VLDICAGYGAWASEARRIWPDASIDAVEIDASKLEHLQKWCDSITIGDYREALKKCQPYDLVIGNPPFSAVVDMPDQVLSEASHGLLMLHRVEAFFRGKAGRAAWRRRTPVRQWVIPGAVKFRTGVNPVTGKVWSTDTACYCSSLWVAGSSPKMAAVSILPDMPAHERSWRVLPGTEEPGYTYPSQINWCEQ
jgi:hypothetical protein